MMETPLGTVTEGVPEGVTDAMDVAVYVIGGPCPHLNGEIEGLDAASDGELLVDGNCAKDDDAS